MTLLEALLAVILALAPLVFVHELGHFLVAKGFGIGVPVFSLGFGPRLFGFRRGGTDYRVSLIPLGGYVRLSGDDADETRTWAADELPSRPRYQRFLVFLGGASANLLFAVLALGFVFAYWGRAGRPELSVGQAAVESLRVNVELSKTLFLVLWDLITGELPLSTVSGPVGIADVARRALSAGGQDFLGFLAFISLQLGILNLLPIPVLDGGHILILATEGVMGRDLSERFKERVMQFGFLFLLALMVTILVLDVRKLL